MPDHTKLLLHGESLTDSSRNEITIKNFGVQVSATQRKFGRKSLYFDGKSRLEFPADAIDYSNQDFTIDWWEFAETSPNGPRYASRNNITQVGGLMIGLSGTLVYAGSGYSQSWDIVTGVEMLSVTTSQWVHWAVVRYGEKLYTYRNGKLFKQTDMSGALLFDVALPQSIGGRAWNNNWSYYKGYIDEFRISDIARWTKEFTPPEAPYVIPQKPIENSVIIDGTSYKIKESPVLVNGTSYKIYSGNIQSGGSIRKIMLGVPLTYKSMDLLSVEPSKQVYIEANGKRYNGTGTYQLPEGTRVTVHMPERNVQKYVYFNGRQVDLRYGPPLEYTFSLNKNIQINYRRKYRRVDIDELET